MKTREARREESHKVSEAQEEGISKTTDLRFSLQTKLTLAFVLVSLIGFVVAFLLLPQLYVRSKEREIEESSAGNVQLLKRSFQALVESSEGDPAGLARRAVRNIGRVEDLTFTGLGSKRSYTPEELLAELEGEVSPKTRGELEEVLDAVHDNFRLVRIVPWEVPPLDRRISFLVEGTTPDYFIPVAVPFRVPERKRRRRSGGRRSDPGTASRFRHRGRSARPGPTTEKERPAGPWSPTFSSSERRRSLISRSTCRNGRKKSTGRAREKSGKTNLYVPVHGLGEPDELVGYFRLIYEPTASLDVWRDLASGPAYVALGIAALLAFGFSVFFVKGITRPIQGLTQGALAIADGKLDQSVEVSTRDEIGVLSRTFNVMRERLRTTLDQLRERAATIEQQNVELDRRFNELRALQNYTENILRTVDSAIFFR